MKVISERDGVMRVRVEHPGEPCVKAPVISGWACFFVGRVGGSYTIFSYRRTS